MFMLGIFYITIATMRTQAAVASHSRPNQSQST